MQASAAERRCASAAQRRTRKASALETRQRATLRRLQAIVRPRHEHGDSYRKEHKAPVVIDNRMVAPQDVCTKDSDHRLNLILLQSGVDMEEVQSEQLCVRKIKIKER